MIFQTSTMLVKQVMSRNQFNNQINETLQRFQRKMPLEFARTLDLIRTTIQGNALIAAVPSNWKFVLTENNNEINASFRNEPVDYVNIKRNTSCSCATSHTCTMSAQLLMDNVQPFILEDLVLGCNLLETVLLSSLSCFYSMKCINTIRGTLRLFEFHEVYYPVQLHANLTRFNVNDSIETLASKMFIESWTSNVSYEKFFNSCAPSICTYKYYYRFDALELLTRFLTVYSGLSLGIKFIVPYLVRIIKKLRNRARIAVL
jgi:hypothetical protein